MMPWNWFRVLPVFVRDGRFRPSRNKSKQSIRGYFNNTILRLCVKPSARRR